MAMDGKPPNYFEGIIQLRNPTEEIYNFVLDDIESRGQFSIAKIKKVKNGVDIYMAPQKILRSVGQHLQKQFGGEVVFSSSVHTRDRQKSKDLHRVHMLFRRHEFQKGDRIKYKGEEVDVLNVSKKIHIQYVDSKKKQLISFDDLKKYG